MLVYICFLSEISECIHKLQKKLRVCRLCLAQNTSLLYFGIFETAENKSVITTEGADNGFER